MESAQVFPPLGADVVRTGAIVIVGALVGALVGAGVGTVLVVAFQCTGSNHVAIDVDKQGKTS